MPYNKGSNPYTRLAACILMLVSKLCLNQESDILQPDESRLTFGCDLLHKVAQRRLLRWTTQGTITLLCSQ